ncbi:glycosyltransferase family 4 protein [Tuwongella immobilis]|uniref:Glycosyltransferase subfamily 4-like N-terminal domain-containing protein n=1 Tax=Tuwongella immobilis TaxID=692036 RepID=A0A6C2YPJ6_9BACT|nr:glycosyltransferase family 4 protein [Tuwongella immobilis]VIP02812.1 Glycosyltransferase OS=Singulisphaera acidiphila (strain ATCC BAA-1392 / DSM 18658 / VKM B-2454 / MOB10) GN=Sinac_2472 PE=4 SV=1: Glyco_trans_4_4: Glycos_transf_1 [Tuwongella immobilis]VTS02524.1 Glycosyltransferase OS=Singulisphaera acidiphila (strain ATCC BAA-1392 / DSM 18658 / VKM B-2454 / MOB10) GN=Sinac_2472 PE=4 SV=1: Glyco_trans_4_4: Glycos_transf_1 [Tuwongella immobilis]
MRVAHLTASTFFGGPERQMLGLARSLPPSVETVFFSFAENGWSQAFLVEVRQAGFRGIMLEADTPRWGAAIRELTARIQAEKIEVLLCHGYKANLLGRVAARRAGIPVVAVSRGWTGENARVKLYEFADRQHLRLMDHVVAVSLGQARKVRKAGVPKNRISIIRNSARFSDLQTVDPQARERLAQSFPGPVRPTRFLVSAGRLSPEKGYGVLLEAAPELCRRFPNIGFVHFGDGPLRDGMQQRIRTLGLSDRFVLAGLVKSLDWVWSAAEMMVLPSFTEGLPNVALEASAGGAAIVATAVGGTPEVVAHGESGLLVPPGEPDALIDAIATLLSDESMRRQFGAAGRDRVQRLFSFQSQADSYVQLFQSLVRKSARAASTQSSSVRFSNEQGGVAC